MMRVRFSPARMAAIGVAALASLIFVEAHGRTAAPPPVSGTAPAPPLSILTYNVHGLPWPLARGRDAALSAIGARLAALRAEGAEPHIVVLQEAFTDAAKRIAVESGYPYVALGPSASVRDGKPGPTLADRRFEAGESWLKGEGVGKAEDSGLMLLSDYPIIRVRKAAFPDYACAGWDCLANKGVLLATVQLPGGAPPVQIATTHLVSRFATGVADWRSLYAYRRETGLLADFLAAEADPGSPLLLAGDFNVGVAPGRRATLVGALDAAWRASGHAVPADALRACATAPACPGMRSPDAQHSLAMARDWIFSAPPAGGRLAVSAIRILFGRDPDGAMLSDHVGYEADYAFGRTATPPRRA